MDRDLVPVVIPRLEAKTMKLFIFVVENCPLCLHLLYLHCVAVVRAE